MRSEHGPSDIVRCIKRGAWITHHGLVVPGPAYNDIVTVSGVVEFKGDEYIKLHEWPDYPPFICMFDPSKFVPIETTIDPAFTREHVEVDA